MKLIYFWKPFICLVLVSILSLIPGEDLPTETFLIPHLDKIVHIGMYFLICVFLISPLEKSHLGNGYLAALICSLFLGALFEVLQSTIAVHRSGNTADWVADLVGALLAIVFYHYFVAGKKIAFIFRA